MNKIEVVNNKIKANFNLIMDESSIFLKNIDLMIIYKDSDQNINFDLENVKLFEYFNNSNLDNVYNIKNNSTCYLNRFSLNCSIKTIINLNEGSKIFYKYSCLNFNDNNYVININHNEKNSFSKIVNNGINLNDSKLDFLINSKILSNSTDVIANQDSKIILMGENNSSIKPNLLVKNNEIEASHSAYLGSFKSDDLFYLASRGINKNDSLKLLAKAFLVGDMEIDFSCKNIILQDLNTYWGC